MDYVQIKSCFLMSSTVLCFCNFSYQTSLFRQLYQSKSILCLQPNSLSVKLYCIIYTITERTLFISCTFLSTHYDPLSTCNILSQVSFTILRFCHFLLNFYGNYPSSHLSCTRSFPRYLSFYPLDFKVSHFTFYSFLTFFINF